MKYYNYCIIHKFLINQPSGLTHCIESMSRSTKRKMITDIAQHALDSYNKSDSDLKMRDFAAANNYDDTDKQVTSVYAIVRVMKDLDKTYKGNVKDT